MSLLPKAILFASLFTALAAPGVSQQEPATGETAQPLRVGISPFPPFVIPNETQEAGGFSIEMWKRLAREIDADYEFVEAEGVREKLAMLREGSIDLAIGGISITREREQAMDFTYPILQTGLDILVRDEGPFSLWATIKGMMTATKISIITGFLVLIVLAGHLMWLAERGRGSFSNGYVRGVAEGMYWAIVTASTVGYGDKVPLRWTGRLLAAIVIIIALPLFSLFTAELASNLTLQGIRSNIQSPADLRGVRVGVVRGSTGAEETRKYQARLLSFETIEDAFDALQQQRVDAVVHDAPALHYFVQQQEEPWAYVVGVRFASQAYGIAMTDGSPLRERINLGVLALRESGFLDELRQSYFGADYP